MCEVFAAAGLMSESERGISRLCSVEIAGSLPKPAAAVVALVVVLAVDCAVAWLAQSTSAELTGGFNKLQTVTVIEVWLHCWTDLLLMQAELMLRQVMHCQLVQLGLLSELLAEEHLRPNDVSDILW